MPEGSSANQPMKEPMKRDATAIRPDGFSPSLCTINPDGSEMKIPTSAKTDIMSPAFDRSIPSSAIRTVMIGGTLNWFRGAEILARYIVANIISEKLSLLLSIDSPLK
jgi:hypothetical protein